MGSRHRLSATLALATTLMAVGCRDNDAASRASGAGSAAPRDHLAPGELAEGKEKAFALPLPFATRIVHRGEGVVVAQSQTVRPEEVANFFRARVKDGTVSVGAAETTFAGVHAPAEPARLLTVQVHPGAGIACEVLVRDVTPPPLVPGLSDEERRRRAGLAPDGKLLDPKHLQ